MSNALHTDSNCAALAEGICERLHKGQAVKVYGTERTGTVFAANGSEHFVVEFGQNAEGFTMTEIFYEADLELI
ncbi:hypothetical protein KHO57_gp025 [Mycobacterium phage Phabba]|uniref:Uncharacterized protein n=1 Tax=Mycobacterium phage Phabba TaxID=2027899 RepID=A0A249XSG7_9CAUD|nr:hypothetical protein KHO57_gp025 [Mycobacterium phage Phabba]ASZ74600.1 hypothetical protein SEA_PHABBA_25 [Mycobacterium phage Phabba]